MPTKIQNNTDGDEVSNCHVVISGFHESSCINAWELFNVSKLPEKIVIAQATPQEFKNNDAGAIEQNINTMEVYRKRRLQTFLEVGLILLILIFGYINGDIIQAIRSKLPTKTK